VTAGEKNNFFRQNHFSSGLQLVFFHIFEIKFVEMSKSAVPAPDDKVPAADGQVVGTGDMTVPAFGGLNKFPEIITTDLRELSFFTHILDPGYENTRSTAVVADHPGLVWNCRDDLIGVFFTMVTDRAVPCDDEPVTHRRL
jgi:hypothetical protein